MIEIGALLATIIPAITKFLSGVGTFVKGAFAKLMANAPEILAKADKVLDIIGEGLDIANKIVDVTDIGINLVKNGKKESYEGVDDYIEEIETIDEEEIKIEKEKLNEEEIEQYKALGIAVKSYIIMEKLGLDVSPDFIIGLAKLNLGVNTIKEVVNLVNEKNYEPKINGMLEGKLDVIDDIKTQELLEEAIKKGGENKNLTEVLKGV